MAKKLDGVKVPDISVSMPESFLAMLVRDMGVDVIFIERTGGSP